VTLPLSGCVPCQFWFELINGSAILSTAGPPSWTSATSAGRLSGTYFCEDFLWELFGSCMFFSLFDQILFRAQERCKIKKMETRKKSNNFMD
jgi:hypothetical protein